MREIMLFQCVIESFSSHRRLMLRDMWNALHTHISYIHFSINLYYIFFYILHIHKFYLHVYIRIPKIMARFFSLDIFIRSVYNTILRISKCHYVALILQITDKRC